MATVNYYIRTVDKKIVDEPLSIRIRLRHNEKYFYARTTYNIKPEDWDKKKQRIKQGRLHSKRDTINSILGSLESHIINLWNIQIDKSLLEKAWLQNIADKFFASLSKEIKESEEITLKGFINNVMKSIDEYVDPISGKKLSPRTIKKHERTQEVINKFIDSNNPGILIKEVDYQFYNGFLQHLTNNEGFAINTVGKYIAGLKMFLNRALEIGIYVHTKNFKKPSEVSDSIYLNEEELLKIYNLDLSEKKRLEKVRDLFIVGCWTGLRFGDLTSLTKDIIKEDKIVENLKTGNVVPIPLHWMTKAILEKYEYNLPVNITNQKFNEYIKEVCDAAEINKRIRKGITKGGKRKYETFFKHKLISAHTARRSFATNLYNSGFPYISIMALTGHKTLDSFLTYIKVSPEEHAEKVEEHWTKADKKNTVYAESLD
ncbi:MAG: phage integrase SAM-like domain-containing protein [Bacteroidales bacterium]